MLYRGLNNGQSGDADDIRKDDTDLDLRLVGLEPDSSAIRIEARISSPNTTSARNDWIFSHEDRKDG